MNKETWIKNRHRVIKKILAPSFAKKLNKKYDLDLKPIYKLNEPCLIMSNHQTLDDQYIISTHIDGDAYFVCLDDLMNTPIVSGLLKWAVNPIPYKKGSVDLGILKKCLRVKNEGGSIIIFPEGNRTYSGETGYINPTITKMAQFLKLPLLFITINGGFSAYPRYSGTPNKAKISLNFSELIKYDDYKNLSNDELYKLIKEKLYVNESDDKVIINESNRAEYLERVIYRCPKCGISKFYSYNDKFMCLNCQTEYTFNNDKTISNSKYHTILEWYNYQKNVLYTESLHDIDKNVLISSDNVGFYEIIPYKFKHCISKKCTLELYSNRLVVRYKDKEIIYLFDNITSSAVMLQNYLNIFVDGHTYQFKDNKRLNALKYMQHIYKYKIEEGVITDDFLGM